MAVPATRIREDRVLETQGVTVEALAREHSRRVFNFCRGVLRHDADAEDACQEVFLTLTRRAGELPEVRSVTAWVMKIAFLTCQAVRRRRGRPAPTEVEADAPADPGPPIEAGEDLEKIRAAVGRLPERYRAVLTLHYQQGMPHGHMAEALSVSRGALRVLLHRAVGRLREELRVP
jgi:RNA polymerase sigma-70 factor (ECF subfamily)